MRAWQQRRAWLCHGQVKNRLLPAIAALVNGFDTAAGGPQASSWIYVSRLWIWLRPEMAELISSFRVDMSPRQVFDEAPLCFCCVWTKSWLPDALDELWLESFPVNEWTDAAMVALDAADQAYGSLIEFEQSESLRPEIMRVARQRCVEFHGRCESLATAVSRFPDRLIVPCCQLS